MKWQTEDVLFAFRLALSWDLVDSMKEQGKREEEEGKVITAARFIIANFNSCFSSVIFFFLPIYYSPSSLNMRRVPSGASHWAPQTNMLIVLKKKISDAAGSVSP